MYNCICGIFVCLCLHICETMQNEWWWFIHICFSFLQLKNRWISLDSFPTSIRWMWISLSKNETSNNQKWYSVLWNDESFAEFYNFVCTLFGLSYSVINGVISVRKFIAKNELQFAVNCCGLRLVRQSFDTQFHVTFSVWNLWLRVCVCVCVGSVYLLLTYPHMSRKMPAIHFSLAINWISFTVAYTAIWNRLDHSNGMRNIEYILREENFNIHLSFINERCYVKRYVECVRFPGFELKNDRYVITLWLLLPLVLIHSIVNETRGDQAIYVFMVGTSFWNAILEFQMYTAGLFNKSFGRFFFISNFVL